MLSWELKFAAAADYIHFSFNILPDFKYCGFKHNSNNTIYKFTCRLGEKQLMEQEVPHTNTLYLPLSSSDGIGEFTFLFFISRNNVFCS